MYIRNHHGRYVNGAGLGVALGGGGGVSPTFLLRDDFTTDEAAPLASPRTAEPGPGTLTIVQTDGQFSISGGALSWPTSATPIYGELFYRADSVARQAGRCALFNFTLSDRTTVGWGFYTQAASFGASGREAMFLVAGGNVYPQFGSAVALGFPFDSATEYDLAVVLRGTGGYALARGGAYADWTLLWVGNEGSNSTLYAGMGNYQSAGTSDYFLVADLGGPWATDYGIATDRLAGSVSAGATATSDANFVGEFVATTLPSAGQIEWRFRVQDASNYWQVTVDSSGNLDLDEVVAGTPTQRGMSAGVVANGDRIVVVADGTTIWVYEANTLRITYSSASNFQSETATELESLGTGGAVSDIVLWPRTISGTAKRWLDASVA